MSYLVISGVVVIVVLSAIAIFYHWKLYLVNKQRQQLEAEQRTALFEKRKQALNSIVVLSRAMLEGQVTLTEASIRISVLIGILNLPQQELDNYVAFGKLAEATAHIPILDDWQALPADDKKRLDKERIKHEKKYSDFLHSAAEKLISSQEVYRAHVASLS